MKKIICVAAAGAAAVLALAKDCVVETAELSLAVSESDASFRVTDRRTGRTWKSEPEYAHMPKGLAVTGCNVAGKEIRLAMSATGGRSLSATFRLEPEPGEMTVTFNTGWRFRKNWEMSFPGPLRTKRGDRLIVPLNEGMGYPVDGMNEGLRDLSGFSGHGLSMGFFGVAEDGGGAGWMAIVEESPEDMRMEVFRLGEERLLSAGARWLSEGGELKYPRRLRYVFLPSGGHVAMCKRYRRYVKGKGWLKTFREKALVRPDVLKLPGSVNIWYFKKDQAAMAKELREAGMERILWSGCRNADPSNVAEIAKIPGVLVGRYDLYQGVQTPELRAHSGGKPSWNSEAWPDDVVWDGATSNDWRRGWETKAWDGTKHKMAMLCPAKAPDYARRKIPPDLAANPYNARFLDTTCSSAWFECKNPAHPLTRRECRLKRMELLSVISEELKLVAGTENGHESAVPVCDYFEGMLSISPYTLPDCGRNMGVIWANDLPELTAKYSMNEKLRLPLWELVFHDCVCNEYYWGDYNNKMPRLWYRKDVFNMLYGTMPMLMFDRNLWNARKGTFMRSYRTCEPVARATGFSEMVDHRFLAGDRSVQETEFSDGTMVTVNFSSKPFRCGDGYEIPAYEYRVRIPSRAEGCYIRDAKRKIDFTPAGAYQGFKVDDRVERRGSASIHTVRLDHLGEGDRAITFAYDVPLPEGVFVAYTGPDRARRLRYWDAPATPDTRQCAAGCGRLPRWPLLAVKAADGGTHAVGIAPGTAAVFSLVADPAHRVLRIAFDLGFTPERRDATVKFAVFSFGDDAGNGYREAWKVWMETFPEQFAVREKRHGTWMVHLPIGDVPNWEDFGFRYKEGYNDAEWDNAHGIAPLHYSSAGAWNMRYHETKITDVNSATFEDAMRETMAQEAKGVQRAKAWRTSRMLDETGRPAGRRLDAGWGRGWTWSMNSAPGIEGACTDFSMKASDSVFEGLFGDAPGKPPLAGEYYDSSGMGMTAELDYDRAHFAAMRTPLSYAKDSFRPVIFKGMIGFEYLKSFSDRLHARGKIVMANEAPKNWCWVAPMCDVLGTEANWFRGGKWTPYTRDEMILRRMQSGAKPFCIILNLDYAAFAPYVERYMQLCLAYGFLPGFFSPKSAADDSHYFRHPEFYERDRALFRKYVPLCRMLSESGWRPVNSLVPDAGRGDVSAEQFGDRYVALYNHSKTSPAEIDVPAARELVTGEEVRGRLAIPPMACRVLEPR